jgi:hypothetical protein
MKREALQYKRDTSGVLAFHGRSAGWSAAGAGSGSDTQANSIKPRAVSALLVSDLSTACLKDPADGRPGEPSVLLG